MERLAPDVLAYYEQGRENARLRGDRGRLEFCRTQDVLRRVLPQAPARVLDVGGGTGVHAEWLVADGYEVELIDPVPLHVEQASSIPGVTARLGDARALDAPDGSFDAVLLLGPLYHLPSREDRIRVLAEARRAVRPGGVVAAAVITRYSVIHDTICQGFYLEEPTRRTAFEALESGTIKSMRHGFTGHAHDPEEITAEFEAAGFATPERYGLEGAFWLYGDVNDWLDDPERRQLMLEAARRLESVPSLLGVSGHLLAVAAG
ncbi:MULTISPECIES: class I SAM-dependent methyltransferase [Nonomuraea]|uniref:Class I SAM-dependent methyltransferase n=1 Tax=Nonomuraea mangrovi TaxID=2316207 RepID=A0ABW4T939_9ACTN